MSGVLLTTAAAAAAADVNATSGGAEPAVPGAVARAVVLATFIIAGFCGNCVLVATIAQSERLKGFLLNLFIISVAICNLLDCIVNMPMILGNTITGHVWEYSDFLCRFNAFAFQFVNIGVLLGLAAMLVERVIAVKSPAWYEQNMTAQKCNIVIVSLWLYAFGVSTALFFGALPVVPAAYRAMCAVGPGAPLAALVVMSTLGYMVPILICIVIVFVILKAAITSGYFNRNLAPDKTSEEQQKAHLEISVALYVMVLFFVWILTEAPYFILIAIEEYSYSLELGVYGAWPAAAAWEVEVALAWVKLSYPLYLPLITLCWRRRRRGCHANTNGCAAPGGNAASNHHALDISGDGQQISLDFHKSVVPVLFATADGLQFQTFSGHQGLVSGGAAAGGGGRERRTVDVFGSQQAVGREGGGGGDTSDYDSDSSTVQHEWSRSNSMSVHTKETNVDELSMRSGDISLTQKVEPVTESLDRDSGTGSYGQNSLQRTPQQCTEESATAVPPPSNTGGLTEHDTNVPAENVSMATCDTTSERKKRRKKRKKYSPTSEKKTLPELVRPPFPPSPPPAPRDQPPVPKPRTSLMKKTP